MPVSVSLHCGKDYRRHCQPRQWRCHLCASWRSVSGEGRRPTMQRSVHEGQQWKGPIVLLTPPAADAQDRLINGGHATGAGSAGRCWRWREEHRLGVREGRGGESSKTPRPCGPRRCQGAMSAPITVVDEYSSAGGAGVSNIAPMARRISVWITGTSGGSVMVPQQTPSMPWCRSSQSQSWPAGEASHTVWT